MRTVAFVDYFELDYHGSVYSKAMLTADVDNDNCSELIIGNAVGELYIYRGFPADGKSMKPWAKAVDLGIITCVQVGDVCNYGMNYVVAMSAEGWCHMFEVRPDTLLPSQDCDGTNDDVKLLKVLFRQRIAANSRSLLIADIDGDGLNELVVAYTDRIVRAYRWTDADDQRPQSSAKGQTCSGRFVLIDKWGVTGQIGSVAVSLSASGRPNILVSQPGGSFVTLLPNSSRNSPLATATDGSSPSDGQCPLQQQKQSSDSTNNDCILYHALGSARARNPLVSTEIIGSISRVKRPFSRDRDSKEMTGGTVSTSPPCGFYSALCTLDGTITLVEDDKILWSFYVDHQLFALTKLDVTGDGMEEVIACSWDGQTYFVNLSKEVVRFQFPENVAAFCAGMYWLDRERGNVPCLFYATFSNKIIVYYNIRLSQIGSTNLINAVQQMLLEEPWSHLRQELKPDTNLQQLFKWCLYSGRYTDN